MNNKNPLSMDAVLADLRPVTKSIFLIVLMYKKLCILYEFCIYYLMYDMDKLSILSKCTLITSIEPGFIR